MPLRSRTFQHPQAEQHHADAAWADEDEDFAPNGGRPLAGLTFGPSPPSPLLSAVPRSSGVRQKKHSRGARRLNSCMVECWVVVLGWCCLDVLVEIKSHWWRISEFEQRVEMSKVQAAGNGSGHSVT